MPFPSFLLYLGARHQRDVLCDRCWRCGTRSTCCAGRRCRPAGRCPGGFRRARDGRGGRDARLRGSRDHDALLGLAFDTCTAPALATVRAWGASPYRAIGGVNRTCGQPQ